jgi:hypothetical protein
MGTQSAVYQTKELSAETWPDFERLFSQGTDGTIAGAWVFSRVGAHPGVSSVPGQR